MGWFSVMRVSTSVPPIHSFNRNLLKTCYVPGPVLGSVALGVNKTGSVPVLTESLSGGRKQAINNLK